MEKATIASLASNLKKPRISREDITATDGRTVGIILSFGKGRTLLADIVGKIFRFDEITTENGKEVLMLVFAENGSWTTPGRSVFQSIEEAAQWTEDCNE